MEFSSILLSFYINISHVLENSSQSLLFLWYSSVQTRHALWICLSCDMSILVLVINVAYRNAIKNTMQTNKPKWIFESILSLFSLGLQTLRHCTYSEIYSVLYLHLMFSLHFTCLFMVACLSKGSMSCR